MHVRQTLTTRTRVNFKFGQKTIGYCSSYKYLGLTINQFLDFGKMSNSFSDPASRALSAVICKMIKNGGFPYNVYETLYNCCVSSISDYAHDVIGYHQYSASSDIHTKAIRSYLGVGRSANLCALRHEMAWLEPRSRCHIKMFRFYFRMKNMMESRLTKKIFLYDEYFTSCNPNLTTWSKEISNIISQHALLPVLDETQPKVVINMLNDSLLQNDIAMVKRDCVRSTKLDTYNSLFSPYVSHSSVISYTRLCLPFILRKRLAQIRLGCLPIRVETDRYNRPIIPRDQRFCLQPHCKNYVNNLSDENKYVENEFHFLIECDQHDQLRSKLYNQVKIPDFSNFSDNDKFIYLLTSKSEAKIVAQFIADVFELRSS